MLAAFKPLTILGIALALIGAIFLFEEQGKSAPAQEIARQRIPPQQDVAALPLPKDEARERKTPEAPAAAKQKAARTTESSPPTPPPLSLEPTESAVPPLPSPATSKQEEQHAAAGAPELPARTETEVLEEITGTSENTVPDPAASLEAPPVASFSASELNKKARAALVNIICTTKRSGLFNPFTGSGIIIDERGVILTNAHVAEYFLLKDYPVPDFVECIVRTGAPARNAYRARPLYISPLWIAKNAHAIREQNPLGTGAHDFAFLLVAESANPGVLPLPESFPALALDASDETLKEKGEVLVAAYPAGLVSGINIQKDLFPSSSIVTLGNIYTFAENTPDLFSLGGSPVAQKGASGGAVVSRKGKLIGLIATATEGRTTGERDLRAITVSHIERSFAAQTGFSLAEMLAGNLQLLADDFAEKIAPELTELLENEIGKRD